ncbi:MAG: AzlC family ABC transporter permease [Clostridiales bacterium]|nr:AzlC family ABC transporter permease [Clostridiales bacterium]
MKRQEFAEGIRDGVPICLGYLSVSFAYGMMAVNSGMPIWSTVLISLSNLTSAGQFAGTNLILAGGTYLEIAMTTFIINIRYFLMSLTMSQKIDSSMTMLQRFGISFGITDEIFAVSMQHPRDLTAPYMAGLILTPVIGWTMGTFFGGILTSLMPKMFSNALNIALYGMFIAIIVPPAREQKAVLFTVVLAIVMSVAFTYLPVLSLLSGGWGIIIITVIVSAIAAWFFPADDKQEERC